MYHGWHDRHQRHIDPFNREREKREPVTAREEAQSRPQRPKARETAPIRRHSLLSGGEGKVGHDYTCTGCMWWKLLEIVSWDEFSLQGLNFLFVDNIKILCFCLLLYKHLLVLKISHKNFPMKLAPAFIWPPMALKIVFGSHLWPPKSNCPKAVYDM